MAYCLTQAWTFCLYTAGFSRYSLAMSGTNGSDGLGSVNKDEIDNNTLEMVKAGLHWSLRMSKQIPPLELMFG